MTHAHNRTMLANFGFADPDRGNDEHDLACQYLASDGVASRLVHAITGKAHPAHGMTEVLVEKGEGKYKTTVGFVDVVVSYGICVCGFDHEVRDTDVRSLVRRLKDDGYRLEVAGDQLAFRRENYNAEADIFREMVDRRDEILRFIKWEDTHRKCIARGEVRAEVKIGKKSIGDCIAQIGLYVSHGPDRWASEAACIVRRDWVLATRYTLDAGDVDMLRRSGIHHVHLGANFTNWLVERRAQSRPADSIDI